ncbi:epsin-1-like isoform X2 [Ptychodera flava]|uniref:epsin-1-like isoform X2 n=1 Tax=Ptychodera flava TaxID=63121 RepID=UPI003969D255
MPIRRQLKNVVNNFSDSQVKVREATSNDPWGPSSSLMTEIADLTYNVVAFSEIMAMIWKRLNDHGKNWRHVYKSLVLLDYIIKTGSERVAQQCKENIFAIQTLKDFQFVDRDGKDQGVNVREKSKQLVALLKDDERLKQERARALKAKERFAQASSGIGSDTNFTTSSSTPTTHHETTDSFPKDNVEMEQARPQTSGEEELQLQLALAMSKEEAEEAERQKRSDDVRLQMALNESLEKESAAAAAAAVGGSALLDLADPLPAATTSLPTADPWASEPIAQPVVAADPWGAPAAAPAPPASDPWSSQPVQQPRPAAPLPQQTPAPDPWSSPSTSRPAPPAPSDPWDAAPATAAPAANNMAAPQTTASPWGPEPTGDLDADFDSLRAAGQSKTDVMNLTSGPPPSTNDNLFDMGGMSQGLPPMMSQDDKKKSASDFLGENSSLVNLDSLIGPTPQQQITQGSTNPFAVNTASKASNPFQQQASASPTLNQMRAPPTMGTQSMGADGMGYGGMSTLPQPLLPTGTTQPQQSTNPFLL